MLDILYAKTEAGRAEIRARALPLDGPPKGLTDLVQPDEFPLNVFYEALRKKMADVIASTSGITASTPEREKESA